MIKIKFPKKISENKIKDFFVKQGLGYLISKKSYFIDGYKVNVRQKVSKTLKDKNDETISISKNRKSLWFINLGGYNPNEILLIPKSKKNKGFFEKFFHLFN